MVCDACSSCLLERGCARLRQQTRRASSPRLRRGDVTAAPARSRPWAITCYTHRPVNDGRRSRVRPTRPGSGNVPGDDGRRHRTGICRRPRARGRAARAAAWSDERRHRGGARAVGRRRRDRHRRRGPRGREVQDAGRDLRHRRLRPRRAGAVLGSGPAGAVRRRRRAPTCRSWPRRSCIRSGTPRSTPGTRCGRYDQALALPANDLAAATALLDARFLTGDRALADKFLAAFRARVAEDRRRGLRGPPARRAEGAPQPLRRHDLPARARSQERPGRHARSLRRALGGDGPLRDLRSEASCWRRA